MQGMRMEMKHLSGRLGLAFHESRERAKEAERLAGTLGRMAGQDAVGVVFDHYKSRIDVRNSV